MKSSYADAYHAMRNARRPVLIVIEGQTPPVVDRASFVRPSRQTNRVTRPVELCRIDATTEYGQKIAKSFGAAQFPYVAITDKNVEVLLVQHVGGMSREQWLSTLAANRTGVRPEPVVCFT
jgi:hypothetical protein